MEKLKISIIKGGREQSISAAKGNNLLSILIDSGIYVSAPCAGRGLCGKCKIQMLQGVTKATTEDKKFFSEEELKAGYRLSCLSLPDEDCRVRLCQDDEEDFDVVAEYNYDKQDKASSTVMVAKENNQKIYDIAIDIGTTTIAISLVETLNNKIENVVTTVNHQRKYGADVVSRIQASIDGMKQELQSTIRRDLADGIKRLADEAEINLSQIQNIVIAANTTMIHLLMGYPCDTLGVAPFTPYEIEEINSNFQELFGDALDIGVTILPGISTYVGADIVAGLMACGFDKSEKINVFVDLGTNGEMAIGNKDKILVTSTAAGPAFEDGNITCGIGSIKGAICHVDIENGKAECQTIGDAPMTGICGTGIIESTYELLKAGLLDETGMLADEYFETGYELGTAPDGKQIVYTQEDIREIQLAKSAIRAGLETLIRRYGVDYQRIDKLYLAGGFGYRMNIEKAIGIGLFPEELKDKIVPVGNSSLNGAALYLISEKQKQSARNIVNTAEEISLAMDDDFNQFYMDYMFF